MDNLHDTLPDLMRRATDGLEPETNDLVQRGMRRGVTLRRRRTALLSFAGAGAILATATVAVGATQLGAAGGGTQVAGPPSLSAVQSASTQAKPAPVTSADTLGTLRKVLPAGLKVIEPKTYGGPRDGFTAASVTVDDGKGPAEVSVIVETVAPRTCHGRDRTREAGTCKVLADGSVLVTFSGLEYPAGQPSNQGVIENLVELTRRDGVKIGLTSYNSKDEKGSPTTRPLPTLSLQQLAIMAESKLWKATTPGLIKDSSKAPKGDTKHIKPVPTK